MTHERSSSATVRKSPDELVYADQTPAFERVCALSDTTVAFALERNDHHCQHDEGRVSSAWGLAHGKRQEPQGDGGPAIGMAAPCPRPIAAISSKPSPPARSPLPLFLLTQRLRP